MLRLAQLPGVTVTGAVPDVRPFVRRSALTIAPLRIARGTQNKVLESMTMGVPVVSSPLAAVGVDAVPGEHLRVADTSAGWCAAILELLEDRHERERMAEAGRARALGRHDWGQAMRRLDGIVASCRADTPRPMLAQERAA